MVGEKRSCAEVWKDVPPELLNVIAKRFKYVDETTTFSAVCKSWNSAASELNDQLTSCLPCKYPWLLLAEDTGLDISACKISSREAEQPITRGDYQTPQLENIPTTRGFFSLVTQKIYNLDLPEATNKLILGTNKGWLVTLGKDLEINLLHPLHRHQIPLPPMLTFPTQYEYDDDYSPEDAYTKFITKVALSSQVPTISALQNHSTSCHLPIIMAIYERGILGCARLGDKFWTNVELETGPRLFHDIVYHKKKFYAINFRGGVFMCDIDEIDRKERQPPKGKMIATIPIYKHDRFRSYMIEALSGSHIWVVLRYDIRDNGELSNSGQFRYYTSNFLVLKLVVHHSDSNRIPTCTWVEDVKDLGNEALFIGRTSSTSVASSDFIKQNCIYFTDDLWERFLGTGGGHDMGIFNVQTGEIQPHFPGISIHRFSPPIWYI